MKNSVQRGKYIDVAAPADVASGEGVRILSLFGIAAKTVLATEIVAILTEGVLSVAKLTTDVMAVGVKVNWNNATGEVQLATSTLDGVGTVIEAAGNGILEVQIKLTPV